jgi:tetratricopeptide (TPR) repeat protein
MGERLVAGHPSKVESHLNRAAALMDYGDILPAQAEIEMAQRLDPNAVWVLMRVADLYIRSGNLGKARDVTNTILMLPAIGAQELSNARYYLGRIYELEGRFQDAVKDYKRALVLYPSNEAATWGLERIYEKLGEKKKAIEVLEDYLNIMRGDIRAGAVLKKLKENEERQFHKNETEKLLEEDIPSDD